MYSQIASALTPWWELNLQTALTPCGVLLWPWRPQRLSAQSAGQTLKREMRPCEADSTDKQQLLVVAENEWDDETSLRQRDECLKMRNEGLEISNDSLMRG